MGLRAGRFLDDSAAGDGAVTDRHGRGWYGALVFVLLAAACSTAPSSGRPASHVEALPDVGKLAPAVQAQLGASHARLATLVAQGAPATEQGRAFGELGVLLLAAQFADAPELFLRRAEALDPADYRWPYYRAQFRRQRGELDQARTHFERVLQLQPGEIASLVWLGEIHLQLGRPEQAEERYREALAAQPSSVSARYGLGRAALARGDARGAIAHFEDVLARDPSATAAHYPLSQAYSALGETANAARHLALRANHEILPADPLMVDLETLLESPQSYETRGIRALEAKDWAAAATAFRKGLDLAPDSAPLHHRLGAALAQTGDRAAARGQYETAIRLSNDQFLAHFSLGVMDQEEGHHDTAIVHLTAALAARPSYVPARVLLASSLRRQRRADEALAEYGRVLAEDAGIVEAHVGYSMTLAQLGRYREARAHLEAALRAAPESTALSHGLARLLATAPDARVRDGTRAREIVERLVSKGRSLDLGETLAMSLAELGEFERAIAVQRDLVTAATRAGLATVVGRLEANLARYERGQACRVPWTESEWP